MEYSNVMELGPGRKNISGIVPFVRIRGSASAVNGIAESRKVSRERVQNGSPGVMIFCDYTPKKIFSISIIIYQIETGRCSPSDVREL